MHRYFLYVLCLLALFGCEPKSKATPVEESSQMERIRGQFVTQDQPVYDDDPGDVLVHGKGYFQQDPTEPPTEMKPEWANMVQGELTQLIQALGDDEQPSDNQLAALLEQGRWDPTFVDAAGQPIGGVTYDNQDAIYVRNGRFVYIAGVVEWTPSADSAQDVFIQLPFERVGNTVISGAVDVARTFVSDSNLPEADRPSKRAIVFLIADENVLKFRACDGTPLRRGATTDVDLVVGSTLGSDLGFWAIYQTTGVKQLGANPVSL